MKFNMVNLGYKSTPDYPYDYRIELLGRVFDFEEIHDWLNELAIPHTIAGGRRFGRVIYLKKEHATMFAMKWS